MNLSSLLVTATQGNADWTSSTDLIDADLRAKPVAEALVEIRRLKRASMITAREIKTLAIRAGVEEVVIHTLLTGREKGGVKGLTVKLLAKRFRLSEDRIGRLLSAAKRWASVSGYLRRRSRLE
jgi:hypothetical protein